MNFYGTYYKKQANYTQIQALKEKFEQIDLNGDKALNKTELANIFAGQDLTQDEKDFLMQGVDGNDDGFLTYHEFTPAFIEFDIDQNADISGDEYDLVKKRIDELQTQTDINAQYDILNSLTATEQQKEEARNNIAVFNIERNVIYGEMDVKKKSILISDKQLKINEIQDYIDNNTLLEFDEAKKLKEIENLNVEKNLLLLEKEISQKKLDLENTNLIILNKENLKANETDPAVVIELQKDLDILAQNHIRNQNELDLAIKELDQQHKQAKIEEKEKLLTKFFVPEPVKELARQELSILYDKQLLTSNRMDMYEKISFLSETRAELIEKIYQRDTSEDPAEIQQLQQEIDQLEAEESTKQINASIAALQVELTDKKIQLKEVMPKSNLKPFDEVRATLEAEITALENEIANLQAQLE